MDSRIKQNPETTFDLVLKVKCQASENEDPVVLWKFPEDFGDQEMLQSVPKFCFPFDVERVSQNQVGQHFTFVLTDIESKQKFGFCRLTSGGKVCLCIVSYLPWFEVYYKLLNTLADYLAKEQENDLNDMLKSLYSHPVPKANTPVSLNVHSYFITPDLTGLPTIPESRNLTEYFVAVDVNNMMQLYASMLHERRIIIISSKLSTLTACVHGSAALLYPMYWQHIYIPVLPPHLLDYCCAPMPYLIGVHLSLIEFIDGRLAKLNAGRGFSDAFEEEITSGGFCGGNSKSYQQWVHTVKKGGALINTAMTKASPAVKTAYKFAKSHAKQGIKEVRSKLKHKESDEEYGTCSSGVLQCAPVYTLHNQKRGNSEKRRLAQTRFNQHLPNVSNHDSALDDDDDDEMDRTSKLSSEDSEEASTFFYDSDDSGETGVKSYHTGEMDLLGEILDTLSTHSSDQGKLSGAKSLDFFRSMDDIDYKAMNKSSAPSESNLALLCSGTNDPVEWNLGQDDSVLHGKQLPPSPRKQVDFSDQMESVSVLQEENSDKILSADHVDFPKDFVKSSSPTRSVVQLASLEFSQADDSFHRKIKPNETLSNISEDQLPVNLCQHPSILIPWQKEGDEGKETLEESGLLREVVSLCKMTSAFHHSLNISEDHYSSNSSGNKA
uniref:UDENN domain-containing protein n=1 Tax=Gopherus agassizii TaxID=38772 RepID=A0A452J4W2_9SAUR